MNMIFQIKQIIITAVLLMIGFSSMAQENPQKEVESQTIKIGEINALSGIVSVSRYNHNAMVQFAFDEINAQGGVLGKKLELVRIDNQSSAIGSKQAAKKAVEMGVVAVLGPDFSSHALGAAPVLQQAKIPMLSYGATNPKVTLVGDYIFRACFIDPFQGKVMAYYAANDLKAKTAVILTNVGEAYSIDLAKFFRDHFERYGGKILWEGDYSASATDFKEQLRTTKGLNPDVIFVPGYPRDSGFIMKQARIMGIKAPFLGGDGWNANTYNYGGNAIDGNYFSTHWHREDPSEISRIFLKRFENEQVRVENSPIPYDVVHLVADAIKRANSTNPEKIRDALAQTKDFPGVAGNITFDQNGDPINKPAAIVKFHKGEIKYVKTIRP